ncbi:hypothetical protein LSTR_LSTR009951 [Laodelphax striatellus]|uniref:Hemimethylated DNA-binding domain-containing protein n=1 Tax=Laodelphax striatellus TaxID=195883 RepID=A0A482XI39_LAOST|nr:hypothetical protein LSTR_LSTR009951 [Laodelphax striatellus]
MPFQRREFFQLSLLLLCVPLQYYVSKFSKNVGEEERSRTIIKTFTQIESFVGSFLSFSYWTEKLKALGSLLFADLIGLNYVSKLKGSDSNNDDDESEIIRLFALQSVHSKVHEERPGDLKYRIGQVIQHKSLSYRGVVIGWEYHKKESHFKQPVYTVLIDETHVKGDRITSFMELAQDQVILLKFTQVKHRHLKRYFKAYDGSQYLPHEWLRKLYPND